MQHNQSRSPRYHYIKSSMPFGKNLSPRSSGRQLTNHIDAYRMQHNITQRTLAKMTGVSLRTLNSVENNRTEPKLSVAMALAEAFEVPIDKLFRIDRGRW